MPLRAVTLLYLYVPLFVFFWGWLRPELALVLTLASLAAARYLRSTFTGERLELRGATFALVVALAWTALSGVGGVGHQRRFDWPKHNAVLKDLIEKAWPPGYDLPAAQSGASRPTQGEEAAAPRTVRPLVFYLAYYLPAALVGKAAGWQAANVALFLWTWCGAALVLLWFQRLVGARWPAALWFVFAGGLDLVGFVIGKRELPPSHLPLDWWAGPWEYGANANLLFFVPHQALGGWLAIALLLDAHRRGASPRGATLEAFGAAFWSPFATIGLLPFLLLRVAPRWREWLRAWPNWTVFPALAALLAAYYAAAQQAVPKAWLGDEIFGPLWRRYLLFSGAEWVALLVLCRPWKLRLWRGHALTAAPCLALVPFVSMGLFNDFCMRVAIPALFVLFVMVGVRLWGGGEEREASRAWRGGLLAAVLVASFSGLSEMAFSLRHYRVAVPDRGSIQELHSSYARHPAIGWQYMGDRDAWFFRRLARELPVPPATTP